MLLWFPGSDSTEESADLQTSLVSSPSTSADGFSARRFFSCSGASWDAGAPCRIKALLWLNRSTPPQKQSNQRVGVEPRWIQSDWKVHPFIHTASTHNRNHIKAKRAGLLFNLHTQQWQKGRGQERPPCFSFALDTRDIFEHFSEL